MQHRQPPAPRKSRPPRRQGRRLALARAAEAWLVRLDAIDRKAPLAPAAAAELRTLVAAARPAFARLGAPPALGPDPLPPGEAVVALLKLRLALAPPSPGPPGSP